VIERPTFDPRYDVRVLEGDGVFLVCDGGARLLRGALYERLVPLIDGERTTGALADALAAEFEPASVYYAVNRLAQKGYVVEAGTLLAATSAIDVVTLNGLPVVVTSDYLAQELEAYNDESLRIGREWLLIKPGDRSTWIGPLFRPGITGCWQCLAHRLWQHRAVDAYLQARGGETMYRFHSVQRPTVDLDAIERELAGIDRGQLEGAVITRDAGSLPVRHRLIRRPNCPACGEPLLSDRAPEPIVMRAQPKRFHEDGGHRTRTPEETLAQFAHHISPVTGIVSELTRTPVDAGGVLNVYITGRNAAYSAGTLNGLRTLGQTGSSGKGTSDAQARASGLCEAIERYSAVFQGDEPRLRASYRDLGSQAIHPATCMLVSPAQYAARSEWNRRHTPANRIPAVFDDTASVEWTPVWSLTEGAVRHLPTALCYLGYPYAPDEPRTCVATSSGNAAGNTVEEAALQAVLELIERDAVALWWYSRARRPGVTLDSFDDPRIQAIQRAHSDLERELWVLDLTSDFNIPVFAALSRRTQIPEEQIVFGFGAHLDPRIAVRRALSEMNQGLAGSLARRQAGATGPDDHEADRWERTATLATEPYLAADRTLPPLSHRDASSDDLRDDVRWCQAALERRGLEMLLLDLTRPDVAMPVVKVIVPGLRPYAPRFAAGRLYDVPVQLGWIPAMLTEGQLNPLPMVP
jgi:bacteriocin biosynthesis cyclodehydratase domain-containing protein